MTREDDARLVEAACRRATDRYRAWEHEAARLRSKGVTLDEISKRTGLERSAVHLALTKRGMR